MHFLKRWAKNQLRTNQDQFDNILKSFKEKSATA